MKRPETAQRLALENGSTVAVIGGGPAGAFFAIHLLHGAKALGRRVNVIIFERRRPADFQLEACRNENWKGCNYCAGGISPKLSDALDGLDAKIPEEIIQSRIRSVTIQGFWKNIELEVPPGRTMLSVYRGSRPDRGCDRAPNFDSFLLDRALKAGASLMGGEVSDVTRAANGSPVVHYSVHGATAHLPADLVVFAAGVNEHAGMPLGQSRMLRSFQRLAPGFVAPRVRQALIFELEARPRLPANLAGTIHFVEYGSKTLRLEMCSLVPKRHFITIVLVGPSVDALTHPADADVQRIVAEFLKLPHIRKLIPPGIQVKAACACRPNMVVASARNPFADRVAAVGDIVTARLYKDGVLSAHRTARALAHAVLRVGIDAQSLRQGYEPTLRRFRKDNRVASVVFLLHRLFFSSSILSRVLYQAVITERKTTPSPHRHLERILWKIASGDDEYRKVFRDMMHPATIWAILAGGGLITLRNYFTEVCFGLRWEGVSRFTTGVAIERLEEKRRQFSRLMADASVASPAQLEFERMYTIKIGATQNAILAELENFGEPDRAYLKPRWVRILRVAGEPNQPGCVIRYAFAGGWLSFNLGLEQIAGGHLAVYRVLDGFARGGMLLFEIEQLHPEVCALSIYVAFNFARGRHWITRPFWWCFRLLFPAFVHDVLWNHSLCQLKNSVEAEHEKTAAALAPQPEPAPPPGGACCASAEQPWTING